MPLQFGMQCEQPRPAIGPLKSCGHGTIKEGPFYGDFFRHQHFIGARVDVGCLRHVREKPGQPHDLPPAMDAAMPVETAMENRMERGRYARILWPVQHQIHLVRIRLADVAKRGAGKLRRNGGGQYCHRNARK